jgi:hypothetical protein
MTLGRLDQSTASTALPPNTHLSQWPSPKERHHAFEMPHMTTTMHLYSLISVTTYILVHGNIHHISQGLLPTMRWHAARSFRQSSMRVECISGAKRLEIDIHIH